MSESKNVFGQPMQACCYEPMTGFYRNGFCHTGPEDVGLHTICIRATEEFLMFSQHVGNDLTTPIPEYDFPGVQPGDQWCLCVERWVEAFEAGVAPPVVLEASHISVLEFVTLGDLKKFAVQM